MDSNSIQKICVQHFVTSMSNGGKPPGFADFLRGTIALYKLCKEYQTTLRIHDAHPIFYWLQPNEHLIKDSYFPIYELVMNNRPTCPYLVMPMKIRQLLQNNDRFSIVTNSFYNETNMGEIPSDAKQFIRTIITPSAKLVSYCNHVFDQLTIQPHMYSVIHLRLGDNYISMDLFEEHYCNRIIEQIRQVIQCRPSTTRYVLLTDASSFAKHICKMIPQLLYWENKKIHLGWLPSASMTILQENIKDTLVDFYILSQSNNIISMNDSGFSKIASLLFDIPYDNIPNGAGY